MTEPRVRLIWSDDWILVIDKPAGLLSLPDGYRQEEPHLRSMLEPEVGRLWIVHRLDRDTSGVMVLARSALAHHRLNDQFVSRDVHKTYHALVWNRPDWDELMVDQPLRKNGDREHRTVIDPIRGKPARTLFRLARNFQDACLIEALPYSGYTHQIRAHLAWAGYPIISDPLYRSAKRAEDGALAQNRKASPMEKELALPSHRTALHALKISFAHPATGQEMAFEAPYPADFQAAVQLLEAGTPP